MGAYSRLRIYRVYGICFGSEWALPYPESAGGAAEIELVKAADSLQRVYNLSNERLVQSQCIDLPDGSMYIHWPSLMEFVISSNGRRILGNPLTSDPGDVLEAYLFGAVFSFALLRLGIEQLHATAVVVNDRAIGFMGDGGFGKSTLAGAFVKSGHCLLTDDLLVIQHLNDNSVLARPGLPRLKLRPDSAAALDYSTSDRMMRNRVTGKEMRLLSKEEFYPKDAPLQVLYRLNPVAGESVSIRIEELPQHKAFVGICAATFNSGIRAPERLEQQFLFASRLAAAIPVRLISSPQSFAALPALYEGIIRDVEATR
jgi:hypothetical protein